MITEALLHCPGVGRTRLARFHELGIRSWTDVLDRETSLSGALGRALADECRRCLAALQREEIAYFTEHFAPRDKWRILTHFLDHASYFDIETGGLEHDAPITVISCWHDGRLHNFVEHENLDDFLDLLDDIRLLVSFNGSSFDVPRILDAFHIPELPCPHLDLRWTCFHQGWTGGLKAIARQAGIDRPADLEAADGELAVRLWHAWRLHQDAAARDRLVRYCAADVLMLVLLAQRQAGRATITQEALWAHLPAEPAAKVEGGSGRLAKQAGSQARPESFGAAFESLFGKGGPQRLRARRPRLVR